MQRHRSLKQTRDSRGNLRLKARERVSVSFHSFATVNAGWCRHAAIIFLGAESFVFQDTSIVFRTETALRVIAADSSSSILRGLSGNPFGNASVAETLFRGHERV